eukprot:1157991-Pelagomonas_calceolata.AAC.4
MVLAENSPASRADGAPFGCSINLSLSSPHSPLQTGCSIQNQTLPHHLWPRPTPTKPLGNGALPRRRVPAFPAGGLVMWIHSTVLEL